MDRTMELIQKAHNGEKDARQQLVAENMGLIWCVVKRFYGRGVEAEDLYQIGSIGLLKAIDKFDLSFQVQFSTYAIPMITGEIKRFLRDDGIIKVSRSLKSISYKAYQLREQLTKEYGREPKLSEIATAMEITSEELVEALDSGGEVESLNRPINGQEGTEIELMEKVEQPNLSEESVVDKVMIEQMLKQLGEKERTLIYLRYYANLTQTEVGQKLGITQVQVSRMEKRILNSMRHMV